MDSLPLTTANIHRTQNTPWQPPSKEKPKDFQERKNPKPDAFYRFQVSQKSDLDRKGLERFLVIPDLSLQRLATLYVDKDIRTTPTSGLENYAIEEEECRLGGSPNRRRSARLLGVDPDGPIPPSILDTWHHAICLPYLIVEFKHGYLPRSEQSVCYYQAADGSSKALSILEQIFRSPGQTGAIWDIPPVVSSHRHWQGCPTLAGDVQSKDRRERKSTCMYSRFDRWM